MTRLGRAPTEENDIFVLHQGCDSQKLLDCGVLWVPQGLSEPLPIQPKGLTPPVFFDPVRVR